MEGAFARFLLALAASGAVACASGYYEQYRAAHPDFEPVLPRQDASLEEVLAALHAPTPVESIEVELAELAIFRAEEPRWSEVPFDAIRRGSARLDPEADYVVLVAWECRYEPGLRSLRARRGGYYLLPGNRLDAYDHYAFRDQCRALNEFRAARGALVAAEREAQSRGSGGVRLSLPQAYRRGLAYVEAGRLPEARAMLLLGERSYRAAAARLREGGDPEALDDAKRLRDALKRALGAPARP